MDEEEIHVAWIRRLERERVTAPPKRPTPPEMDDSPEATARRRKALEKALDEHDVNRHLKVVGG